MEKSRKIGEELLSAYLDGEVTPEERAAVEEALARDEALNSDLAGLKATRESLRGLTRLRAPRSFTVEAPAPRRRWLPLAWRWATVTVALLLVVVIGWEMFLAPRAATQRALVQASPQPASSIARAPAPPTAVPGIKSLAVPENRKALKATPAPSPTPSPTSVPAEETGLRHRQTLWVVGVLAVLLVALLMLRPRQRK